MIFVSPLWDAPEEIPARQFQTYVCRDVVIADTKEMKDIAADNIA